jgi:hypothetical protein
MTPTIPSTNPNTVALPYALTSRVVGDAAKSTAPVPAIRPTSRATNRPQIALIKPCQLLR